MILLERVPLYVFVDLKILLIYRYSYHSDFTALVDLFNRSNIDVVLCDHLVDACVDAAKATNKTFIITLVAETTKGKYIDSSAPYINMNLLSMTDFTTEFETVYERFMNAFVLPVKIILNFAGFFYEMGQRKNALGVTSSPDPSVEWKDNIKLVNSLFGITPARPVGPLVEHVGPILPRKYIPLDHDLQQFMDDHTRVGYVALGQHSKPNTNSLEMLLTSVLQTYESGELDGIIWSTVNTKHRFPESVTTSSNKTYIVSDIFEHKYPDFYFSKWASQTAILMHPSTHLFISHGGLGSWYESMYAGVREVVYPFFGDQLGNGLIIERGDMGAVLDSSMSIPQVTRILKDVAADVDNRIQSGVKRMQALVQIHSRNGAKLGADIVEEVAFTNINGKLPHRYEASRKMSFIKAHNIDIIGIFVAITLSVIFSSSFILVKIYKFISYQLKSGKKMKTQ
ncbi:glycosyltransferase family 1 protein [Backusella circina FSU 941]|nr:glycosyltransferase family 1 protein [Backusella circina FSU 941]